MNSNFLCAANFRWKDGSVSGSHLRYVVVGKSFGGMGGQETVHAIRQLEGR